MSRKILARSRAHRLPTNRRSPVPHSRSDARHSRHYTPNSKLRDVLLLPDSKLDTGATGSTCLLAKRTWKEGCVHRRGATRSDSRWPLWTWRLRSRTKQTTSYRYVSRCQRLIQADRGEPHQRNPSKSNMRLNKAH